MVHNYPYCPPPHTEHTHPITACYKPLAKEEIRLIRIRGLDAHGTLTCSLENTRLDIAAGEYVAVSYTWNEADPIWYHKAWHKSLPVLLDKFAIQMSAKVATILALMQKRGRTLVWIDAICIDQSDLEEKAQQVGLMGDIYAKAFEVESFLGSPDNSTDICFDAANSLSQTLGTASMDASQILRGASKIHYNSYWRRAWILQEISLARKVVLSCGSRCTSLEAFENLQRFTDHPCSAFGTLRGVLASRGLISVEIWKTMISEVKTHGIFNTAKLDQDQTLRSQKQPFLEVLQEGRYYNMCRDPRDLLLSRLSLATDATELIPRVDYGIPTEELYAQFAVNCIEKTDSLEVIFAASNTTMNLPSWIPDWTSKDWPSKYMMATMPEEVQLDALSWNDIDLPRVSTCRSKLIVQGRVLYTLRRKSYSCWLFSFANRLHGLGDSRNLYSVKEVPRVGDVVCILRGSPSPVHLRPTGEHYKLVGRNWISSALLDVHWIFGRHSFSPFGKDRDPSPRPWEWDSRASRRVDEHGNAVKWERVNDIPEDVFTIT